MTKKVLVVASKGGHWVQLMRLRPAWKGQDVHYIGTDPSLFEGVDKNFHYVTDANLDEKFHLFKQSIQVLITIMKVRPKVVVSTGASVGFFALLFGKLFFAKTIWIDSIANASQLSTSGEKVKFIADVRLTQWPEVAKISGAEYRGKVF